MVFCNKGVLRFYLQPILWVVFHTTDIINNQNMPVDLGDSQELGNPSVSDIIISLFCSVTNKIKDISYEASIAFQVRGTFIKW